MNNRILRALTLGGAAALLLLTAGCSGAGSSSADSDFLEVEAVSQTFPYTGQTLTIDAGTADLIITSGEGNEVQVDSQATGSANSKDPEVTESLDGDTLTLAVKCDGLALGCKGRFTVTVPEGVAVIAQNKNQQITVTDFAADLTVSAVNGTAKLSQISSPTLILDGKDMEVTGTDLSVKTVLADTRNGSVDLTFSDAPDQVTVDSNDGNVRLVLPDTDYLVETAAKKGKINVTVAESDSSSRVISVTVRNADIAVVTE